MAKRAQFSVQRSSGKRAVAYLRKSTDQQELQSLGSEPLFTHTPRNMDMNSWANMSTLEYRVSIQVWNAAIICA